jgi:hypothetical protein
MKLNELTTASGMSKNKTFRLLKTLEFRGIIDKDTEERYYFGINTFILARHALNRTEMPEVYPSLKQVAAHLNEDVYLARKTKGQAVLVAVVNSSQKITIRSYIGSLFQESPAEKNTGSWNYYQIGDGVSVSMGVLDTEITTVAIDIPVFSERSRQAGCCGPDIQNVAERIRIRSYSVLQETVRHMEHSQAESMLADVPSCDGAAVRRGHGGATGSGI